MLSKIKILCENVLSTGDDVAGGVNIFCWVDVDVGLGGLEPVGSGSENIGYDEL